MHASHVAATHRKGKKSSGSPKIQPAQVTDSGKKRKKGGVKAAGPVGWVPVIAGSETDCWVLGRRGEVYGDIRSSAIVSGSLFARAIPSATLDVGDHLPRRPDSMLLHPDTMRLCGFAVAQPVAIRHVTSHVIDQNSGVVICKPWPFKKLDLDAVALSATVFRSFVDVHERDREEREPVEARVEVWRVPSPSLLPPADELHLTPLSAIDRSVLNESFKNYVRSLYDGLFVCEGNRVSVPFCNEQLEFAIERVVLAGQSLEPNVGTRLSFNTSRNLTLDSLRHDLSGLYLGGEEGGGGREGERGRNPHLSISRNIITSTPGMDVDEIRTDSGAELGQVDGRVLKWAGEREECSLLLEQQMQGLDLGVSESGGGGERGRSYCEPVSEREEETPVEVTVCKVSPKTKIVFLESVGEREGLGVVMDDIGGMVQQKQLLRELVAYPLNYEVHGIQFPSGVLLYGPLGVGKSLLARALPSETSAHTLTLSPSDLTRSRCAAALHQHILTPCAVFFPLDFSSDSPSRIEAVFKEARERSPSLILLDDLHSLSPTASASLSARLDDLHIKPSVRPVVVVATTNHIEAIDSALRRPGRFDREIEITTPSAVERRELLEIFLRGVSHCVEADEVVGVADSAHGYTGSDLRAVCMQAQHRALHRWLECEREEGVMVSGDDVRGALREVRPSAMREVVLEVPKVLWSDIGGQEEVKRRLREAVEWPLQHPEAFSRLGISPPKGVLLFGPPGCSKTMIARALATESGLNFIAVKGPELFSKWVGDSERAVRQVFQRARNAAPAIIFFDEIDALAVQRKSDRSSVADRVLAQLLTEMDGVEMLKDVLIVAATNRPDMIDKALLRPGRIDRMIYVPLPSDSTRREIFEINFRTTPVDETVSLEQLVAHTRGFSGAEVVALCQEAALCAMHEDISVDKVSLRHFQKALQTITPQTQPSTIALFEQYNSTP